MASERNECGVITLFPMSVSCSSVNPTSSTSSDGSATLIITGGTPPYLIQWANGNINQTILNLSKGSYTATVSDSDGDNVITVTCNLVAPTTTTTTTTTTIPVPPCVDFCLTFEATYQRSINAY
jgi:hypothetical protein